MNGKKLYLNFLHILQSNDKYWRHKQVFWVWFTTEPKKVLKSLKFISYEATQRSKNAISAARPIAGIIRKK